jgi:hypothetical protein
MEHDEHRYRLACFGQKEREAGIFFGHAERFGQPGEPAAGFRIIDEASFNLGYGCLKKTVKRKTRSSKHVS